MMNVVNQKKQNSVWEEPVEVLDGKREEEWEEGNLLINFPWRSIISVAEMGENSLEAKTYQMTKEQAEKILKKIVKQTKRIIKKKIALYEPLELKATTRRFLEWLQEDEFRVIREMNEDGDWENRLEHIVRNFLIENAYYTLEEKHIRRRVMNKLGLMDPDNIKLLEIVDFIIEGIERDGMKRLKTFGEKCKFKTFMFTVVSSLLNDFWRHRYKVEKNVTRYETDFQEMFDRPQKSPLEELIQHDDETFKAEALELIPAILDTLDADRRVAIKLKYEKKMKLSAISRTIGRSRFKTEQFIKEIERSVAMKIKVRMNDKINERSNREAGPGRRL